MHDEEHESLHSGGGNVGERVRLDYYNKGLGVTGQGFRDGGCRERGSCYTG